MKFSVAALILTASALVAAEVAPYYQCGGKTYTGDVNCSSGFTCQEWNEWYYQCIPSGDSAPKPSKSQEAVEPENTAPAPTEEPTTSEALPVKTRTGCKPKPKPTSSYSVPDYGNTPTATPEPTENPIPTPSDTLQPVPSPSTSDAVESTEVPSPSPTKPVEEEVPEPTVPKCKRSGADQHYRYRRMIPIHPAH